jgi:hypothetical protein
MSSNEQLAVPVWDGRSDQYVGMLTMTDMLELLLMCNQRSMFGSIAEGMRAMTLGDWMSNYARPSGCPDVSVEVGPDDDLMVVLRTLIQNDCRGIIPALTNEANWCCRNRTERRTPD